MGGANSNRKGKRFEREVVRAAERAGFRARRLAPLQARIGSDVPDVELTVHAECVFDVECKAYARKPNPLAVMPQAVAQARRGHYPAVICTEVRPGCPSDPMVTLRLDDFLDLLGYAAESAP
jgi:hypothetical protein